MRARATECTWPLKLSGSISRVSFNYRLANGALQITGDDPAMMTKEIGAEHARTRHASRWTQSDVADSKRAFNGEALIGPFWESGRTRPERGGVCSLRFSQRPRTKFCFSWISNRRVFTIFFFYLDLHAIKSQLHSNLNFYRRRDSNHCKKGGRFEILFYFYKIFLHLDSERTPYTLGEGEPSGCIYKRKNFWNESRPTQRLFWCFCSLFGIKWGSFSTSCATLCRIVRIISF